MSDRALQGLYALLVLAVLLATVLSLVICFFKKGRERTSAINWLLTWATALPILLVGANYVLPTNSEKNPFGFKESEQIDSLAYGLNQTTELSYARDEVPLVASLMKLDFILRAPDKTFHEDLLWLSKLLEKHASHADGIAVRLALVGHASGQEQCQVLNEYDSPLARVMQCVLCDKNRLDKTTADQCIKSINSELPGGWFRETALLAAYDHFGEKSRFDALLAERKSRSALFGYMLLVRTAAYVALFFTGLFVIVRFAKELPEKKAASDWHVEWQCKKIWSIALAALYAQALVGLITYSIVSRLTAAVSSSMHMIIVDIATIIGTALTVIIATRRILLKPANLTFLDGLRLRSPDCSLSRSAKIGFLSYCSAITLVLMASLIQRAIVGHNMQTDNPIAMRMVGVVVNANASTICSLFIAAGVIAPIGEEILFRGLLYPYLRMRMSMWPAALISGGVFSLCHWDIPMLVQIAILGTVQAIAVERTRNLTTSIVMHGLWNSGLLLALIMSR